MDFVNLKQYAEFLPKLARWHQQEWSYLNPGQSLQDRIEKMQAYLNDVFIPSTFVAVENDVLGSAAIIECDMDTRPELSPWLASVYVAPEYRKQGVGTALVQHIIQQACDQGYTELFLYTPDQEKFYQQLGWQIIERVGYHDVDVTIMSISLKTTDKIKESEAI